MLQVKDLCVAYTSRRTQPVSAVRGVTVTVPDNTFVGLVGESGCGKSTLGYAIAGMLDAKRHAVSGEVLLNGQNLLDLSESEFRKLRWRKISIVLQGGMNAFNPVLKIKYQFIDVMRAHSNMSMEEMKKRIADLLMQVSLGPEVMEAYPHELSGGMKQRTAIALALCLEPELVIMDEPTTALDVVVQRSIVNMLKTLQSRLNFSVLFISHDLGLVLEVAQRVMVMYAGQIVESKVADKLLQQAEHPYTQALLNCYVDPQATETRLVGIPGAPPDLSMPIHGCTFAPRCSKVFDYCRTTTPLLFSTEQEFALCHLMNREGVRAHES